MIEIHEYFADRDKAVQEDVSWVLSGCHKRLAEFVVPRMEKYGLKSVIEFGCTSGLLALQLPANTEYFGVDGNDWFLQKARERNFRSDDDVSSLKKHFKKGTILERLPERATLTGEGCDLVMCWSHLKHYAIDQFETVLASLLAHGRHAAFDVQILPTDIDDGTIFHHSFVTEDRVKAAVAAAGHEIIEEWVIDRWAAHDETAKSVAYWTRRVTTEGDYVGPKDLGGSSLRPDAKEEVIDAGIYRSVKEGPVTIQEAVAKAAGMPVLLPATHKHRHPRLEVDGLERSDYHNFSLRWTEDGTPILYHKGRRVTKAWHLSAEIGAEEDEAGENANTSEG